MIVLSRHSVRLALVWLVLAADSFGDAWAQQTEEDAIYAYTDDRGRLVHAQRLQDVPMHLRRSARRVDTPSTPHSFAGAADQVIEWLSGVAVGTGGAQEPILYRYLGAGGRPVYTNLEASVPPSQRAAARVDLGHVSLNSQLGSALNEKLQERFEALSRTTACSELRSEVQLSWWQLAWRDHRVAVVCALILLVLLMWTPWMHRRGWGGPWARVLWTGLPLLGFVALSATVLMKANTSLRMLAPRAERCDPAAFQAAPDLRSRFSLVSALEAEQAALAQIERE